MSAPSIDDLTVDPEQSTAIAQRRLSSLAEWDGEYPEDVPEPVRNAWRGRRALEAVELYADRDGNAEGEPVRQYVQDLLSDLMHLCDLFEDHPDADAPPEFDSLVARAQDIYADEADRP